MKQKNNNRMSKLLLTTLMVAGSLSAYADSESTLTGTIKDEKGEPLIGVTVMDKTTKQGVTTDENGRFTLEVKKEKFCIFLILVIRSKTYITTERRSISLCSKMSSR